MERTKLKKADAILTGDWHLREDQPICRTDDFESAQWKKVDFVSALQKKHDCPVLHSGDLFNHWKPSPYLIAQAIIHLPDQFYTVFGNHDLPQHNLDLANKCGIHVLEQAGKLTVLPGCHWRQIPKTASIEIKGYKILLWHLMTYQGKLPYPDCPDPISAAVLRKYVYDLILTGHNHKPFAETYGGRLLINPGSLSRQEAGQIDYEPRVYLWYADNTVTPVYLPIDREVISREHIAVVEERDHRIDAFIKQLNGDWEASLSFEDNLEEFKKTNQVRKSVMDIIDKSLL